MKRKFVCCLILLLCAASFIACEEFGQDGSGLGEDDSNLDGNGSDTNGDVGDSDGNGQDTKPKLPGIDFAKADAEIQDVFTKHAGAIGTKDLDKVMLFWLKSESQDVFTVWDFGAGAFEKNVGWQDVKNGWGEIFRLLGGPMTVDILSVEIDASVENARLKAKYRWGWANGDLIAGMKKDESKWLIETIDYTNERFGKQIQELKDSAYTNP